MQGTSQGTTRPSLWGNGFFLLLFQSRGRSGLSDHLQRASSCAEMLRSRSGHRIRYSPCVFPRNPNPGGLWWTEKVADAGGGRSQIRQHSGIVILPLFALETFLERKSFFFFLRQQLEVVCDKISDMRSENEANSTTEEVNLLLQSTGFPHQKCRDRFCHTIKRRKTSTTGGTVITITTPPQIH